MIRHCSPPPGRTVMTYWCRLAAGVAAPLEEMSLRMHPIPAMAQKLSSGFSCGNAISPGSPALTSRRVGLSTNKCNYSRIHSAAHLWSSNLTIEAFDVTWSSSRWFRSRVMGGIHTCEANLRSTSFGALHNCAFTTAVLDIREPPKVWSDGAKRTSVEENERAPVEASASNLDDIPDVEEKLGDVVAVVNQTEPSMSNFESNPLLEKKLKFLETCGLGSSQLEQMRKRLPSAVKNTVFKLSLKKLIEVSSFLENEVGVEKKDFAKVLFANPYVAGSSIEDCLRPKIDFLRDRGISKEQMGKIVLRSPQFLTYSLEGKLLAIEQKLVEVGLKGEELGKVFVRYPAVFGTSISKFDKNVQALKDVGITQLARAIFKLPQIMSLSLDNKFKQIMQVMRDELLLEKHEVARILSCQISIVSFSVQQNIRPKVQYFGEIGLQKTDIARLVLKYPTIFCHSLDNSIKPKVQYLFNSMNLTVDELISFPHYLSYSLRDRIIPRHEFAMKNGLSFRLSSLLSCGEDVFQKRFKTSKLI